MKILAERMKWLRESKRLSQKEVAIELGLSLNGLQKIEYDDANPKIDTLIKIAKYYNVSTDFLLGLTNEIPDSDGSKIKLEVYSIKAQIAKLEAIINKEKAELDYARKEIMLLQEKLYRKELDDLNIKMAKERIIILERFLKDKKATIVSYEHDKNELEYSYQGNIRRYFKYLLEIPSIDINSEELVNEYLPVRVKINQLFDSYFVEILGNSGLNFTYFKTDSYEEAKEQYEKLLDLLSDKEVAISK